MFPRAGCWCPVCITAGSNGTGVRRWSWRTWGIWGRPPNNNAGSGGGGAVLTKLRSDMKLVPPYVAWDQAACPQGEPLTWLGYDGRAGEHWFGVSAEPELCRCCWEAAGCPPQFAYQI